jgi:hypothetical protein
MGMTGILCGLSPERRRLLVEDPGLVHDLADRSVEVPGRHFFDALRLPKRIRAALPQAKTIVALLGAALGHGFGDKGAWAYGRPRIVDAGDLEALGAELDALAEDAVLVASRAADPYLDPIETETAAADDAFLVRLRTIVRNERAREGALLVHVT